MEKKHCRYLGYGLGFLCMGIIKGIYEIWAYVLLPNDPSTDIVLHQDPANSPHLVEAVVVVDFVVQAVLEY